MKISIMFVAVLSLASIGCKKKATDGNDCAKAINNSMALSKAEMEKAPGMDTSMLQKLADLGAKRCTEDKWSADAVKCMVDAKTMTEAQGCYGKLTPEQQEKMNKAAMEMAMGAQGAGGAGSAADETGSAGSAAGSDSAAEPGSAAAGSAEAEGGSAAGSAAAPE